MKKEFIRTYKKNMKFFKEYRKEAYEVLTRREEDSSFDITLSINDDKNVSIVFEGKELFNKDYSRNLEEITKRNIFFLKKKVFAFNDLMTDNEIWKDSLHLERLQKIQQISKKYITEDTENKTIPLLIVYGVGTGYHIEQLLKNFRILHLVIVDLDLELIRPMLYLYDFTNLLEDTEIYFIYSKNPDFLAKRIKKVFSKYPLYVRMFEEYYLYHSSFFDEVQKELSKIQSEVLMTFGFFDDEIVSLKHTMINSTLHPPFYRKKKGISSETPLFIVGSGPSLDQDIEVIKKLRDKAVIFSCGTALKPLVTHDIYPDVEFILERMSPPYEALVQTLPKKELTKLTIIASQHAYPEIFKLGGRKWCALRSSDCGSFLFSQENFLVYTTPTVTNFALSFALHVGFREIYLFGVDLGFKNLHDHHSKSSVYYTSDKFEKDVQKDHLIKVEGNFDEEIYTTDILYMTKIHIENLLRLYAPNMYNCSKGAKINGTKTIHTEEIVLYENIDKKVFLETLEENFDKDYFQNFSIKDKIVSINELFDDLMSEISNCNWHFTTLQEALKALENIYHEIYNFRERDMAFYTLVKGTLLHMLTFIHFFLYSIGNEDKKIEFIKSAIEEIMVTIKMMKEIYLTEVLKKQEIIR